MRELTSAASESSPSAPCRPGRIARTAADCRGHESPISGRRTRRNESSFLALRKNRNVPPVWTLSRGMQSTCSVRSSHGASMWTDCCPLALTSILTKRTAAGEKDARPRVRRTTTLVGRALLRTTLRRPVECTDAGQSPCIVSVTVSQLFDTVALTVTCSTARFVSRADAWTAANPHTMTAPHEIPRRAFMAADLHRATRSGKFQAVRFVEYSEDPQGSQPLENDAGARRA